MTTAEKGQPQVKLIQLRENIMKRMTISSFGLASEKKNQLLDIFSQVNLVRLLKNLYSLFLFRICDFPEQVI